MAGRQLPSDGSVEDDEEDERKEGDEIEKKSWSALMCAEETPRAVLEQ